MQAWHPVRETVRVASFAILAFLMNVVCSTHAFAHVGVAPPGRIELQLRDPHEVVEIYFRAVDRGELLVFERKIDKSMLVPVSVEYVYALDNPIPRVKVYSELKEPLPVPGHEGCKIHGVSAILDPGGRIIETAAHIRPE